MMRSRRRSSALGDVQGAEEALIWGSRGLAGQGEAAARDTISSTCKIFLSIEFRFVAGSLPLPSA